jgi:hypothetical protein
MEEITGIKANQIQSVLEEHFPTIITKDWFGLELVIRRTIPLAAVSAFIERITNACFDDDELYKPAMRDITFRAGIITLYSNVELPLDSDDELYSMLYGSDLYHTILIELDPDQINDIKAAIDAAIEYRIDLEAQSIRDGLAEFENVVNTLEDVFSGISNDDVKAAMSAIVNNGSTSDQVVKSYIKAKLETENETTKG